MSRMRGGGRPTTGLRAAREEDETVPRATEKRDATEKHAKLGNITTRQARPRSAAAFWGAREQRELRRRAARARSRDAT